MPQSLIKKPTLLIDFDGVLHDYRGWVGAVPLGKPIEKSRASMHLLAMKYRLVCFTTRPVAPTESWLHMYGFPYMKVTNIKEPAECIIDDRALTFTGAWTPEFLERITSFKPHWAEDEVSTIPPPPT